MNIGPIGGAAATPSAPISKPESMEVPGAPDHDHDTDDSPANATANAAAVSAPKLGRVDVKA
ncbi:MAG TPA: hypothetical protein VN618_04560 [Solirubrobacteraceae bacterium]|nr:hypothetical protein [Solirubrobacteraceae bacterium]